MFCKYCGKEIKDNEETCVNCKQKEINSETKKIYDKNIEEYMKYIEPKNGNKHVMLVEKSLTGSDKNHEKIYNIELNKIIDVIQNEGYEILNVKITNTTNYRTQTLIIYQ